MSYLLTPIQIWKEIKMWAKIIAYIATLGLAFATFTAFVMFLRQGILGISTLPQTGGQGLATFTSSALVKNFFLFNSIPLVNFTMSILMARLTYVLASRGLEMRLAVQKIWIDGN